MLLMIPFFFAFYRLLVVSVELRHAPFVFWVQDLSREDPYFILPVLMGVSQLVMQKMTTTQVEGIQAKIMMFMPVVFVLIMAWAPSGLVLYWFANNLISMGQQAVTSRIMDRREADASVVEVGGKGKAEQGRLATKADGREVSAGAAAHSSGPLNEALTGTGPPVSPAAREQLAQALRDAVRLEGSRHHGFFALRKTSRATTFGRPCSWAGCCRSAVPSSTSGAEGEPRRCRSRSPEVGTGSCWSRGRPPPPFWRWPATKLGLGARVRVVRQRLKEFLRSETGQAEVARAAAVTMRAVKLQAAEWTMLAAGMPAGAPVIWPTSRPARESARLESGLFGRGIRPCGPGGCLDRNGPVQRRAERRVVSRETQGNATDHRGSLGPLQMRILAVVNQKGGVGKTTTTVNLGAALAMSGHRCLVVDLDPQSNLTTSLGLQIAEDGYSIYDVLVDREPFGRAVLGTGIPNLTACPSDPSLAAADLQIAADDPDPQSRALRLRGSLSDYAGDDPGAEFVLLDCPPSLGPADRQRSRGRERRRGPHAMRVLCDAGTFPAARHRDPDRAVVEPGARSAGSPLHHG